MPELPEQRIKVFVYGTLKRGEPNHHWLAKAENVYSKFISEARTLEKFPLVIGTRYNVPFLLDKRGTGHQVCGEVYEVDEAMLAKLDELEQYPKAYDRELQTMITSSNDSIECWIYLIRNFPKQLLAKKHLETYHNSIELPFCDEAAMLSNINPMDDLCY